VGGSVVWRHNDSNTTLVTVLMTGVTHHYHPITVTNYYPLPAPTARHITDHHRCTHESSLFFSSSVAFLCSSLFHHLFLFFMFFFLFFFTVFIFLFERCNRPSPCDSEFILIDFC
jgi:hypothetical protein